MATWAVWHKEKKFLVPKEKDKMWKWHVSGRVYIISWTALTVCPLEFNTAPGTVVLGVCSGGRRIVAGRADTDLEGPSDRVPQATSSFH